MNENEMKSLENRLASWRPRRPSAMFQLKRRLLFSSANLFSDTARLARWLVPVTACLLLAVLSVDSENSLSGGLSPRPAMAMILSNQNSNAYWPELDEQGQNSPPPQIFKWTNLNISTSSMRFTPLPKSTD